MMQRRSKWMFITNSVSYRSILAKLVEGRVMFGSKDETARFAGVSRHQREGPSLQQADLKLNSVYGGIILIRGARQRRTEACPCSQCKGGSL